LTYVRYTEEFVARFRELSYGQRLQAESSIRNILSAEDPTALAHHLERQAYFCSWSHRVRSNLIIVFRVSKNTRTFISTGTHSQTRRRLGSHEHAAAPAAGTSRTDRMVSGGVARI
jgi:hypothetical protein